MSDPYYQKLPFTLEKQQSQYEFLVLGTGLHQCLISAYLSKTQRKKGIIIDMEKSYGSLLKTVSLKQFDQLVNSNFKSQQLCPLPYQSILTEDQIKRNKQTIQLKKQKNKMRGYNIDIQTRVFYGNSIACNLLREADMDKYMDFRIINNILFLVGDKFQQVPLSKGMIFDSKVLGLLQKKQLFKTLHNLMKIYYKYNNIESDTNSTNQYDKDVKVDQSLYTFFLENINNFCYAFLEKIVNKNKKIFNLIAYVICNFNYNLNQKIPQFLKQNYTVKSLISRFGRFVTSCGVYGPTPYLYVDNGIGDIPQAYSRIASIFGSTFILHPKIQITNIQKKQQCYEITTNLYPDGGVKVKNIHIGTPYVQYITKLLKKQIKIDREEILRVLLICKKPENFKYHGPHLFHIYENNLLKNPITLFTLDSVSSSCPQENIILTLQTVITQNIAHKAAVEELIKISSKLFQKQVNINQIIQYTACYIQKNNYFGDENKEILHNNWGIDLDGTFEQFKNQLGQKNNYFRNQKKQQEQQVQNEDYYGSLLNKLDKVKKNQQKKEQQKNSDNEKQVQEESQEPQLIPANTEEPKKQQEIPKVDQKQQNQ